MIVRKSKICSRSLGKSVSDANVRNRSGCLERDRRLWRMQGVRQGKKQGAMEARHAHAPKATMFLTGHSGEGRIVTIFVIL